MFRLFIGDESAVVVLQKPSLFSMEPREFLPKHKNSWEKVSHSILMALTACHKLDQHVGHLPTK